MPLNPHANASRSALHEAKRTKPPVRAASTANVTLSSPGAAIDGVTLSSGDGVLLKDQTTPSQNGPYVWTGASATLTRRTDASASSDFLAGDQIYVREGTANGGSRWTLTTSTAITLGTTSLTYVRDGSGAGTVTSVALTVPTGFSVSGSPVTSSGTLAVSESTQSANTVKAGPTTGSAATPAYRALVAADLPAVLDLTDQGSDPSSPSAGAHRFYAKAGGLYVKDSSGTVVGALSSSGGGGAAGGSGAPQSNALGADVTITTTNTFYDGPSLSLAAGTWVLAGFVEVVDTSGAGNFTAKLWDGSTVIQSGELTTVSATSAGRVGLSGYVTLSSTTTIKISVTNSLHGGSSFIKASTPQNSAGNNASSLTAVPAFGYSQSASAAAVASSGTITTTGITTARVSPTGAVTGVILQAGTYSGQPITVLNEAIAANSVTFAASGTSNVADGTSSVIAGLTARSFVWDSSTSLWYPCK